LPQIQPAIVVNVARGNIHLRCYDWDFEIGYSIFLEL